MKSHTRYILLSTLALTAASVLGGCSGGGSGSFNGGPSEGATTATIQFANSALSQRTAAATAGVAPVSVGGPGGGPVDISEIASLTVTVTRIELQRCDDDDGDDHVVSVRDFEFDPASITIEQGDTVRWIWETDTEHTVTSGEPGDGDAGSLFDESASGTGSVVELTFVDEGPFPYFSNLDEDIIEGMSGVVNVEPDDEDFAIVSRSKNDGDGERIVVFSGAADVDLVDPVALSEALTSAEVPAGDYCGIRLHIENPRLVLTSDPETVITNVHLTANGRLFVKERFTIEEGKEVLILVDFGGMHLVKAGNSGKYVLTPQLKVEIEIVDAAVSLEGEIVAIDETARVIQVQTATETLDVAIGDGTVISSDDDADDAADTGAQIALVFEDLAVGQSVSIDGLLTVAGPINANVVAVADEDIVTNLVAFDGTITSVDGGTSIIQVDSGGETFDVFIGGAVPITTDDDSDDAADLGTTVALAFGELAVGQVVSIEGSSLTGLPTEATAVVVADDSFDTTV